MNCKQCTKCGAKWINGVHYWSTGALGDEADLAGLVCNRLGDHQCVNPKKGDESGDTWGKREEEIFKLESDSNRED